MNTVSEFVWTNIIKENRCSLLVNHVRITTESLFAANNKTRRDSAILFDEITRLSIRVQGGK